MRLRLSICACVCVCAREHACPYAAFIRNDTGKQELHKKARLTVVCSFPFNIQEVTEKNTFSSQFPELTGNILQGIV